MKVPNVFASKMKKMLFQVIIAVGIAIPVRAAVIGPYHMKTDAVSPKIPKDSYVVVYKLARTFTPGDIVAYRSQGKALLGCVIDCDKSKGIIRVKRREEAPKELPLSTIIGRVIINTR